MSDTVQDKPPVLSGEGQQWIVIFVNAVSRARGPEAIGPFETPTHAAAYADVIDPHDSIRCSTQLLEDEEPQLAAPDPEVLLEVDARMAAKERLGRLSYAAQPRVFPHENGYHVFLGFDEITEYAVTEEGEHTRLPRSEPLYGGRTFKPAELPEAARAKVLDLAETFAAEHAVAGPEL